MLKKKKKKLKRKKPQKRKKILVRKASFSADTISDSKKSFTNFRGLCKGCGICIELCPQKCIKYSKEVGVYKTPAVECDIEKCIACLICERSCPDGAITIEKLGEEEKLLEKPKSKKLLK